MIPGSAAVAQLAVNQLVVGSNPTPGAKPNIAQKAIFVLSEAERMRPACRQAGVYTPKRLPAGRQEA